MRDGRFGAMGRLNAVLAWTGLVVLGTLAIYLGMRGNHRWFFFSGAALALVLAPAAATRNPMAMPPWILIVLALVPVVDATLFGASPLASVTRYLAVATVALIIAVDVHRWTSVRMTGAFSVGVVILATISSAAVWNVALWATDHLLDREYIISNGSSDAANAAMMMDFLFAAMAGSIAGVLLYGYLRRLGGLPPDGREVPARPPHERRSLSDRLDLPVAPLRQLSYALQIGLAGLLVFGFVVRDVPTTVNAGLALGVTFLPAALQRNIRIPLEPELIAWLTVAAVLHALGSAGLYDLVALWDSLTHAMSSSLVAAAGYVSVRAIDLHSDRVYLPSTAMFGFILLFTLSVGVVWELAEFGADAAARSLEVDAALAQHGIADTIGDMAFNLVGAIVAATLGATYLAEFSQSIVDRPRTT